MAALRPVSFKKFEKFLLSIGCKHVRIRGDHYIYDRPGLKRPVIVPYGKEVAPFIIRNNLRTLGMSVKEYSKTLEEL